MSPWARRSFRAGPTGRRVTDAAEPTAQSVTDAKTAQTLQLTAEPAAQHGPTAQPVEVTAGPAAQSVTINIARSDAPELGGDRQGIGGLHLHRTDVATEPDQAGEEGRKCHW